MALVARHCITEPSFSLFPENIPVVNDAINEGGSFERVSAFALHVENFFGIPSRPKRFWMVLYDIFRIEHRRGGKFLFWPQNNQPHRFFRNPSWTIPVVCAYQFDTHNREGWRDNSIFGVIPVKKLAIFGKSQFSHYPSAFNVLISRSLFVYGSNRKPQNYSLNQANNYKEGRELSDPPLYLYIFVILFFFGILGWGILLLDDHRYLGIALFVIGCCGFLSGETLLFFCDPLFWRALSDKNPDRCDCKDKPELHRGAIVLQKYLDRLYYCSTVIGMANVLNTDKQIAVIGALTEGSSIRSIERITGVHRDTIMRLGVKVGQGCARMMDAAMRDLPCNRLEMDEIWGFVGKKDRNVREGEDGVGSVWTFCAIDAETKLVPAFKCGQRDAATADAFVRDVAERMAYRVQISTDGLNAYVAAMQNAFGEFVDYGQIIKTYGHEEVSDNRRYSAPKFVSSEKKTVIGIPDERLISTSYVERLNATTRLHMRRLTRLTLAFSKKRENFEAAVALHFAYYNFVKRHNTLRCTPAMAAGVTGTFWGVGELLEAAA